MAKAPLFTHGTIPREAIKGDAPLPEDYDDRTTSFLRKGSGR
jgi:hypothetical protein